MTYYSLNVGATKERVGKSSLLLVVITLAVAAALAIFSTVKAEEPEVKVITGNTAAGYNDPGWLFNRDATAQYEFTKDKASRGSGSLYVGPISAEPSDKFIAEYFHLGSVDEFEEFSYDFMLGEGSDPSDAKHFYLNVYVNLPESPIDKFYDCRFDYVPANGSDTEFTSFVVDKATPAVSVAGADCPVPASEGLNGLPEASNIRAFSINVGDGAAHDAGVHGYLDNVVLVDADRTTIFDFEPLMGAIIAPSKDSTVQGTLSLEATYNDNSETFVQWAVRQGTCAANQGTVLGNVDGFSDAYSFVNGVFSASFDVSTLASGEYCFVFNPGGNQNDVRESVTFLIKKANPTDKEECMQNEWATFGFRNQGLCIQYVNTGRDSR